MARSTKRTSRSGIVLALAVVLGGCGELKQADPKEGSKTKAQARRQQAACGSSAAYDRLKGLLFDQAIGGHDGDRGKLDTLADYSFARMENPVVQSWDPALDIISCKGRFILQIPPGAQRAFGGEHRLTADIAYTAQAAADGSGFVYQLKGGEPIAAKLAAFNLATGAYRPPPAIDEGQAGPDRPAAIVNAAPPAAPPAAPAAAAPAATPDEQPAPTRPDRQRTVEPELAEPDPRRPSPVSSAGGAGETTVRAFYGALGAGNGEAASDQVVAEKRASRAFSPDAISRFYGRLPEPIRLTGIMALAGGSYRVRYRYSTGRSRCDGSAIVSLVNRGGRDLIRSIRATSGC